MDFEFGGVGTGDKIDVSSIDANTAIAGNQAFAWGGTTLKGAGYLYAENSASGDTIVKGNVDGDATAEFQVAVADGATNASLWLGLDFVL